MFFQKKKKGKSVSSLKKNKRKQNNKTKKNNKITNKKQIGGTGGFLLEKDEAILREKKDSFDNELKQQICDFYDGVIGNSRASFKEFLGKLNSNYGYYYESMDRESKKIIVFPEYIREYYEKKRDQDGTQPHWLQELIKKINSDEGGTSIDNLMKIIYFEMIVERYHEKLGTQAIKQNTSGLTTQAMGEYHFFSDSHVQHRPGVPGYEVKDMLAAFPKLILSYMFSVDRGEVIKSTDIDGLLKGVTPEKKIQYVDSWYKSRSFSDEDRLEDTFYKFHTNVPINPTHTLENLLKYEIICQHTFIKTIHELCQHFEVSAHDSSTDYGQHHPSSNSAFTPLSLMRQEDKQGALKSLTTRKKITKMEITLEHPNSIEVIQRLIGENKIIPKSICNTYNDSK